MNVSELALLHRLVVRVWQKKYRGELPDPNQHGFGNQADAIRKVIQDNFNCFRMGVEDGRGFRDNMRAVLTSKIDIANLPIAITIEAMCGFLYGEEPKEPAEWKEKDEHKTQRIWWERFKREELQSNPISQKDLDQLSQKLKSAEEQINNLETEIKDNVTSLENERLQFRAKAEEMSLQVKNLEEEKKTLNEKLEQLDPPLDTGVPVPLIFLGLDLCSIKTLRKFIFILAILFLGFALASYFIPFLYKDIPLDDVTKKTVLDELKLYSREDYYKVMIVFSALQLGIISLFFYLHFRPKYGGSQAFVASKSPIINAVLRQFELGWNAILVSWGFLYLWFTFKWAYLLVFLSDALENESYIQIYWQFKRYSGVFSDLFSIISSLLFFYVFLILDTYSINSTTDLRRNRVFVQQISFIGKTALIIFLFASFDRLFPLKGLLDGFPALLYSLFPAVGMAMFFDRLSSRFFDSDRLTAPFLYSYAALQVTYPFLDNPKGITYFILGGVTVLKIVLILIVNERLKEGEFTTYISNSLKHISKN